MKTAIVNLGSIVSGDWRNPFATGDAILTRRSLDANILEAAQAPEVVDVPFDCHGVVGLAHLCREVHFERGPGYGNRMD